MGQSINFQFLTPADLSALYEVIAALRGEGGCPWDKKQTPESLKKYLLEETYEVLEAIDKGYTLEIMEELGDLLFLLLFIIYLYEERGDFTFKNLVLNTFNKMVSRHPHVFGEEIVQSAEEVLKNWQKIKEKEGKGDSVLGNIPKSMPALQRAFRIGERAGRVGFDWSRPEEVLKKVYEELKEVEEALAEDSQIKIREEIGDLLFAIANLSRKLNLNPEEVLREAVKKFEKRFRAMEQKIKVQGRDLKETSLEEMDEIWERLKKDDQG